MYNISTFTRLGLPLPPLPDNAQAYYDDALLWSWENLTQSAITITKHKDSPGPGFDFEPGHDEELSLFNSLASGMAQTTLFKKTSGGYTDYGCGLNEGLMAVVNSTIGALMRESAWSKDMGPADDPTFQIWNTSYPATNPLQPPFQEHYYDGRNRPLIGIRLTAADRPFLRNPEIGVTIPPNAFSTFYGYGLAMAAKPTNSTLAFNLMLRLASLKHPYMRAANLAMDLSPPLYVAETLAPWNVTARHKFIFYGPYGFGTAFGYPFGPPPQLAEIAAAKPFRSMLAAMLLKGVLPNKAGEDLCAALTTLFLPPCTLNKHLLASSSPCDPYTNEKTITFSWRPFNTTHPSCRPASTPLPPPSTLYCHYVSIGSPLGAIFVCLTLTATLYALGVAGVVWAFREHRVFKSASALFCLAMLLGCTLMSLSTITLIGPPSTPRLLAGLWLFFVGCGLVFGSLLLKLYRIWSIFVLQRRQAIRHVALTDQKLLGALGLIVALECALLLAVTLSQSLAVFDASEDIRLVDSGTGSGTVVAVTMTTGQVANGWALWLLIAANGLLVVLSCGISLWLRGVPADYKETYLVAACVYSVALVGACVLPIVFAFPGPVIMRQVAMAVALWFSLVFLITVFFVPKLLVVGHVVNITPSGSMPLNPLRLFRRPSRSGPNGPSHTVAVTPGPQDSLGPKTLTRRASFGSPAQNLSQHKVRQASIEPGDDRVEPTYDGPPPLQLPLSMGVEERQRVKQQLRQLSRESVDTVATGQTLPELDALKKGGPSGGNVSAHDLHTNGDHIHV